MVCEFTKILQGANIPASVSIADMIEFGPCLSQTGLRNKIRKCQDTLNDEIRENTDADQDTRCG